MIIRKPYAILIKYFKIIHIVLFVLMTYMLFKVRNIYVFFKNFLISGTYTYIENMATKYINIFMIIASIILVALVLLIFFLMRQKKKPIFYYISATIFYFITFASLIFFLNVFNNLEFESYSNQALVIFRDISMVLYYLNFYFIAISFVRGFGFNIKKFNFEKDIKELDITDADREEIEVGSNVDISKVGNYLRRKKRNIGYYFKENSFILIVFLVIIVLSITSYIALNKLVFNKIYKEQDLISLNNLDYKVNASYITNKDKYNNIIKKGSTYLIIDFNVLNKLDNSIKLEIKNSRIKINNKYYYPVTNASSKFNDIGVMYNNQSLKSNVNNRYLVIYEIEDSNINNKIIFQIYYGKRVNNGEAILYYKDVSLNPYDFKEEDIGSYKLGEEVNLNKTYLKNGKFKINSYESLDIVNYTYTKCSNNKCAEYNASVVPRSGKKILKIDYTSDAKVNLFNYLNLEYEINSKVYKVNSSNIRVVTPSNYNEKYELVEVIDEDWDKVKFIFDLRGYKFSIQ